MKPLAIYLRDHEAAAQAGLDLFRRAAANQRHRSYGGVLDELALDIETDLVTLRGLMRRLGVRPDPALGLLLRAGERIGRLKPNGQFLRRAPLSDLIEIEGMLDAVNAKAAGWRALAGRLTQPDQLADLNTLTQRAAAQAGRLSELQVGVAAEVLLG